MTLQTQSEPVNQTSFAKAVRLGTESVLDAAATTGTARGDNVELAIRWFHAAEGYAQDDSLDMAVLEGLRTMIRGLHVWL